MRRIALALALLSPTLLAGCGGSEEDFERDLVEARDRTDAAMMQVTRAQSIDDLFERLRIAAAEIRGAASDVREADAPDDLGDEEKALEDALRALSDEIFQTVNTFTENPEMIASARGFDFQAWYQVQDRLADLRREGIEVPALQRHAAPKAAP